jgi:hypothetical protein
VKLTLRAVNETELTWALGSGTLAPAAAAAAAADGPADGSQSYLLEEELWGAAGEPTATAGADRTIERTIRAAHPLGNCLKALFCYYGVVLLVAPLSMKCYAHRLLQCKCLATRKHSTAMMLDESGDLISIGGVE